MIASIQSYNGINEIKRECSAEGNCGSQENHSFSTQLLVTMSQERPEPSCGLKTRSGQKPRFCPERFDKSVLC
jgi:hypothetical protein